MNWTESHHGQLWHYVEDDLHTWVEKHYDPDGEHWHAVVRVEGCFRVESDCRFRNHREAQEWAEEAYEAMRHVHED